ncbi:hypothetical protein K9N68_05250 [Kovacikia minuta CCNUW1]|uniref:alr0857 family protein n=1 Tax=Kovacikia minuta TaxID=2931930 RepID=UPI001CCC93A9|nr:alr0857 family protein [Kovacikia minuta]UBF27367.1 hypothetical protein K9N68_05250 [Kovacikia minuta CCNUW1]
MLKFTYTESGIHLEHLTQSLEELIALRTVLAMRIGERLIAEPGTASFLLPANLPLLHRLSTIARSEKNLASPYFVDAEFVEICLHGTWLSSNTVCAEGLFFAELGEYAERLLLEVWQTYFSLQSFLMR